MAAMFGYPIHLPPFWGVYGRLREELGEIWPAKLWPRHREDHTLSFTKLLSWLSICAPWPQVCDGITFFVLKEVSGGLVLVDPGSGTRVKAGSAELCATVNSSSPDSWGPKKVCLWVRLWHKGHISEKIRCKVCKRISLFKWQQISNHPSNKVLCTHLIPVF